MVVVIFHFFRDLKDHVDCLYGGNVKTLVDFSISGTDGTEILKKLNKTKGFTTLKQWSRNMSRARCRCLVLSFDDNGVCTHAWNYNISVPMDVTKRIVTMKDGHRVVKYEEKEVPSFEEMGADGKPEYIDWANKNIIAFKGNGSSITDKKLFGVFGCSNIVLEGCRINFVKGCEHLLLTQCIVDHTILKCCNVSVSDSIVESMEACTTQSVGRSIIKRMRNCLHLMGGVHSLNVDTSDNNTFLGATSSSPGTLKALLVHDMRIDPANTTNNRKIDIHRIPQKTTNEYF